MQSEFTALANIKKYEHRMIVCMSNVYSFSWDHCKTQEKIKTMLMQYFGGTNKEYYGIFDTG